MPKICTKWKFFERLEYRKKNKINAAGKIKDAGRDEKLLFFYLPYKHVGARQINVKAIKT